METLICIRIRKYFLLLSVAVGTLGSLGMVGDAVLAHGGENDTHTITMTDEGYTPEETTIAVGDTIRFQNAGTYSRWPASNIHPTHSAYPGTHIDKCDNGDSDGMFDACDEVLPGESFDFTFTEPGNWRYHDHITPELNGLIVVEGEKVESIDSYSTRFTRWLRDWWQTMKMKYEVYRLSKSSVIADWEIDEVIQDGSELELIIRAFGAESVMSQLLEETGGGTVIDCHDQAHEVGRVAYQVYGAEVFEAGDESCHSGFYHGAMEGFIGDRGTSNIATSIEELCDTFDTTFGLFECLHGAGHGVMAYEDYDLLRSLDVCDELSTEFAQSSCYGGVFMENVVVAQGNGVVPGHSTTWVDYNDPHYPCSAITGSFNREQQCYMMQTSWMLYKFEYDFEAVANACQSAPEHMRSSCYVSFGRDAAGHTLRNPQKILEICAYTENNQSDYESCIYGAVNVILDFWGAKHTNQADLLCEQIPNDAARHECETIIENRLVQIFESRR